MTSRPEILAATRRIYVSRAQRGKPSREKVLSGLPPRQSSPAGSVRLRCGSRLEIRASSLICTAGAFILPSLARMPPARHDSFPPEESPSSLANDGNFYEGSDCTILSNSLRVEVTGVFQAVDAKHENLVIADLDSGIGVVPVALVRWSDVLSMTTLPPADETNSGPLTPMQASHAS